MVRRMTVYCGIDNYDNGVLKTLCDRTDIQGIVVGDLFCQKRMFHRGLVDLVDDIRYLSARDKRVIYQTPLYPTSRNWEDIEAILSLLSEVSGAVILTEDLGIIHHVQERYPALTVGWVRMGRSRDYEYNSSFFHFLADNGVRFFETDRLDTAARLKQAGLEPWLVYGNLYYKTIGRICYCQYQLGADTAVCNTVCRSGQYALQLPNGSCRMSLDGYMMGETLCYSADIAARAEKEDTLVVYAKTLTELQDRLQSLNSPGK